MVKVKSLDYSGSALNLYLFLGVNGVGKTTSLAKLAFWLVEAGARPCGSGRGRTRFAPPPPNSFSFTDNART